MLFAVSFELEGVGFPLEGVWRTEVSFPLEWIFRLRESALRSWVWRTEAFTGGGLSIVESSVGWPSVRGPLVCSERMAIRFERTAITAGPPHAAST